MRRIKTEVVVIGPEVESRIVGQLIQSNTKAKVTIALSSSAQPSEAQSILFAYPGHIDNFTRLASAHGREFAKEIWQMSVNGLNWAKQFFSSFGVVQNPMQKLRILRVDHELNEARQAVDWMRDLEYAEEIYDRDSNRLMCDQFWSANHFQLTEPDPSFYVSTENVLSVLRKSQAEVIHLEPSSEIKICREDIQICDSNLELHSELIVMLDRSDAIQIFPVLKDILIPVKDQWVEFDRPPELPRGDQFIIANHGNIWGAMASDRIRLGGARYLQDLTRSDQSVDFTAHMRKIARQLNPAFGAMHRLEFFERQACYPCDELPVVGPYFADHRVILTDGFWGWGVNMLMAAGRGVAGLIAGQDFGLPRRLWPERLRSL